MKNLLIVTILILILIVTLVWPFTTSTPTNTQSNYKIVVSNFALYDITKHLSDAIDIENILPFGTDIHMYDPSPKDIVKIKKSDLFIFSGKELEPWIEKFSLGQNNFNIAKFIDVKSGRHHHHESEEKSEGLDPHYWLDVSNMIKLTEAIAHKLIKELPAEKNSIEIKRDIYISQLKELDLFYKNALKNCELHTIVTNHNAFEYLADSYGFDVRAIHGLSSESQSSAHIMKELIELVKKRGVETLFFESFVSDKLIQTLAKESGIKKVEMLFPLANVTQQESQEGFIMLMKQNAQKLSSGLKCHNDMVKIY